MSNMRKATELYGVELPDPGITKADQRAEEYAGKLRSAGFEVTTGRRVWHGSTVDAATSTVAVDVTVTVALMADKQGVRVTASWVRGSHGRTRFEGVWCGDYLPGRTYNFQPRVSHAVGDLDALAALGDIGQWRQVGGFRR
jgi:hypothetical protein